MLEIVSKGFKSAKAALTGKTELTEANINEAVREIRVSLLEADVEIGVVRTFLKRVKDRAIGEVVQLESNKGTKKVSATPGEHFILICQHELEQLMGPHEPAPLVYRRPFTTIMMVGLQGTGKTTTTGKLAKYLLANKRKPLLVAADVYRPAAVEQLKVLGEQLGVPVYAKEGLSPPQLCQDALREAKKKKRDVVIFDTAGRLAVDEAMMVELDEIKERTNPDNIFLVCDAMAGQDTVRTASEFNRRLDLTGFIMTKLDGDARGGAALSIKEITGKPIKFLGVGEGMDKLEEFRAEGLASRILGMGDIVGLMKDFEEVVDEKQAEKDAKKMLSGQFTLQDFLSQIKMIQKVGSLSEIYEKFPIFGDALPDGAQIDDNAFKIMESMIQSMTQAERDDPKLIDKSRASRIAKGSGRKPEQVQDLIQRFSMMHGMMANLASSPGLLGNLPGLKQLGQMRKMKGMGNAGLEDLLGSGGMPGMPGMPGGGMPGMPGGGMPGMPGGGMPGMPGGITPEQIAQMQAQMGMRAPATGGARAQRSTEEKQKAKAKRKAGRAARKKRKR